MSKKLTEVYQIFEFKDPNDRSGISPLPHKRVYSSFAYITTRVIPEYMSENLPIFKWIPFEWVSYKGIIVSNPHPSNIEIVIHRHHLWDIIER